MPQTLRSLFTTDAVTQTVRTAYGLDVTSCTLIRSFVNDVYEITTPERRCALKLYEYGGWSPEEVAWEQELIAHLAASGVPVSPVVPLADGRLTGVVEAPEGPRPYAMVEFVEGDKPQQPFTDELYHAYGRLAAGLHQAADSFRSTHYRRRFGLELTLDEPLARVLPVVDPDDRAMIREVAAAAREQITELAGAGLEWGIRHGDVTLDNVHQTSRGLVIHDFDLAAEAWRADDLAPCMSTPFADAFRAGYTEVRALKPVELEALPWLSVAMDVGNLCFHLCEKTAWRGTESLSEGWASNVLESLRARAAKLL